MSTINTENLILYSCKKLYNGSRYKVYQSGTGFNYDTWLANTDNSPNNSGNLTVYFKSITEPITIDTALMNADTYTYGCITNGTDETHYKKYYFFVDNITTDQNGRSTLTYSIDWWATEWANIQLTKGHITRNKNTKPGYMAQPYTPLNTTYTSEYLLRSGLSGSIMFTYIPSEGSVASYISTGMLELNSKNLAMVQNGYWYNNYNIPGKDIKDCFIVPLIRISDIINSNNCIEHISMNFNTTIDSSQSQDPTVIIGQRAIDNFNVRFTDFNATDVFPDDLSPTDPPDYQSLEPKVYNEYDNKFYVIYKFSGTTLDQWHAREVTVDITNCSYMHRLSTSYMDGDTPSYDGYYMTINDNVFDSYEFNINNLNITTTDSYVMGIQDWNSDSIWQCPYGVTITSFNVRLIIGLSHIMLEFIPNGNTKNGVKLTGAGFCYDCRHPGLFIDEYQDYVLKNREYDIAMRQIQSEKQEIQAWFSAAENVGFGMAFGDKIGAQAAGAGGVIEAVGTFVSNQLFDPKIQQQYDKRYQLMTDQISLVGDAITDVYNERNNGLIQIYKLTMDTATQTRMNNDINTNGYYCDETTNNLQSLITQGNVIQADNVTVEGLICKEGRQQIVYRLQNGVEFI